MTAETRRDLIVGILRELYRADLGGRGRSASGLHRMLTNQIACEPGDVDQLLPYLRDKGWIVARPPDDFAPTLEAYWDITAAGKTEAVIRRIV